MEKSLVYSILVIISLTFSGCGSSSSSSEDSSSNITGYPVVVERGPVLDANVTDANGSVAVQASEGNNTYVFEEEPVYPITAEGGWIDVDGDGNLTENDVALDINLTSYTDVITPTTTYCSDENETVRQEKLEELAYESNCTVEELLTVPSKGTKNSIIVLNAVYEKLMERNNTRSSATIAIGSILERYREIYNNTNIDENTSSEDMAAIIEESTINNLVGKGLVKKLDADDIKNIKSKKPKKLDDESDDSTEDDESDEYESDEAYDSDSVESEDSDDKVNGKGKNKKSDDDSSEEDEEDEKDEEDEEDDSDDDKANGNGKDKGKKPKK